MSELRKTFEAALVKIERREATIEEQARRIAEMEELLQEALDHQLVRAPTWVVEARRLVPKKTPGGE